MKKKLKTLLIFPPVTRPGYFSKKKVRVAPFIPLGIAYLGAVLESYEKFEVKLLDALIEGDLDGIVNKNTYIRYGLSDNEIIKKIKDFDPDIVGVSCLFSAMEWDSVHICNLVKSINSKVVTIIGGGYAGSCGEKMLKENDSIDFIIIGEAEITLKKLLLSLDNQNDQISDIDGLIYRKKGIVTKNFKTKFILDLDTIPFPALHLLPMEKYFSLSVSHTSFKNKPYMPMITSRGCPAKCTFCAISNHWGEKQRRRSAKNVLDEIEFLIRTYGIKEIHFEDDNLAADKKRALDIFNGMIGRKFNITWTVPSGMAIYTLDDEILEKMKDSGCFSVSLPVENANQEILTKIMCKPVNLRKVKPVVEKIRSLGMEVRGFFILGFPGETKNDMNETIKFAREHEFDWAHFFIFAPLPGTKIYEMCIDKGYINEKDIDPLTFFYEPIIETPEFSKDYLKKLWQDAIIDVDFKNNPNLLKYGIDKAIKSFKSVLSTYPHFDFANFYLGEAYLKKGLKNEAIRYYKKTLKFNKLHKGAIERLKEIVS